MELTIDQALQQAVSAHNLGNIKEAESLYQAILQSQPGHPDANHNLGLIAISMSQIGVALPLFKTALDLNPSIEQFWISYTDALVKDNQLKAAKQVVKKAKKKGFDAKKMEALLSPSEVAADAEAPSQEQLSSLAGHYQNGRYEDAEKLARSLSIEFPRHHLSWKVLGAVLTYMGRLAESLVAKEKAVDLAPHDAEAHSNLGNTLHELDRLEEAEASLRQAIALKPDFAEAHNNLGIILNKLGRFNEAMAYLKHAIELDPNSVEARINLNAVAIAAVPSWHLSMMNDEIRNQAYYKALKLAVDDGAFVLDIGTGSGLLSLMAAAHGAGKVISCETSTVIADAAKEIIESNGYGEIVSVVNKMSTDLLVGQDLPQRADIIISEVLSAELVGEGVQNTLLDAKKRLLKNNGTMIPQSGKIIVSLIGNSPEVFDATSIDTVHGFDLSKFNLISQNKFNLNLKTKPLLLSNPENAFDINFYNERGVVIEDKIIKLKANQDGLCLGVIQWLSVNLYKDIKYENRPGENDSHWPTPIYLFDEPITVKTGDIILVRAVLSEDSVWFYQKI